MASPRELSCGSPECTELSATTYCSSLCRSRASYARKKQRYADASSKVCPDCKVDKAIDQYTKPWAHYCAPCTRERRRARYRTSGGKEQVYAQNLASNYGMTPEQYEALAEAQFGRCAICGTIPEHRLNVDHDHRTGAVRELLCRQCNHALGNARDDAHLLRAMAAYLERHQQ